MFVEVTNVGWYKYGTTNHFPFEPVESLYGLPDDLLRARQWLCLQSNLPDGYVPYLFFIIKSQGAIGKIFNLNPDVITALTLASWDAAKWEEVIAKLGNW